MEHAQEARVRIPIGPGFLDLSIATLQSVQAGRDVLEGVLAVSKLIFDLFEDAVPTRGIGADHDVIGGYQLCE